MLTGERVEEKKVWRCPLCWRPVTGLSADPGLRRCLRHGAVEAVPGVRRRRVRVIGEPTVYKKAGTPTWKPKG